MALVALAALGGCMGAIAPEPEAAGTPRAAGPGTDNRSPGPASEIAARAPLRRLTREQYNNSVRDLLGIEKSLLDLVLRRSDALKARLGRWDQVRLERHFDEIRALELRVTQIPDLTANPVCKSPVVPAADPALDPSSVMDDVKGHLGWADEDRRGRTMRDLITMAFTCDLTRSAFLLISYAQSYMMARYISGDGAQSVHGASHNQMPDSYQDITAWHVEHFAALAGALSDKNAPDVDGSRMIDNTVIILCTEGGAGRNPEGDAMGPPIQSHSTENMSILVAGGRNLGLKPGRHIPRNNDFHPAAVIRTAMRAVGVDRPLGNVTADLPEL